MTKVVVDKKGRRFYGLTDELLQCNSKNIKTKNQCVCAGDLYKKNQGHLGEDDLRKLALGSCNLNAKRWATGQIAEAVKSGVDKGRYHKDRILGILGSQISYPVQNTNLIQLVRSIFLQGSHDRWLAETIMKYGPEPLWPKKAYDELKLRDLSKQSTAKRNGVRAVLGHTAQNREIEAYYFAGRSNEHALVIAGVHGTERSGVEIAEQLIKALRNSPKRPYFSLIIVPCLFPDNYHWEKAKSKKRVLKGLRETCINGKGRKCKGGVVIPTNRNFPPQGMSVSLAEKNAKPVKSRKDKLAMAEGHGPGRDEKGRLILRENKILTKLMNRFRPSRILSLHATWKRKGAGIFSETVKVRYNKTTRRAARSIAQKRVEVAKKDVGSKVHRKAVRMAEKIAVKRLLDEAKNMAAKDKRLALRMAKLMKSMGMKKAVLGNKKKNAKWGGKIKGGTSLGMWGSSRINEKAAEDRDPIVIITLEAPKNHRSDDCGVTQKKCTPEKRIKEIEAFRDVIQQIFLENPDSELVSRS